MATTGIHSITVTLNYAIEYICQDYKTDNGRTIQTFACTPKTAAAEMLLTQKIKGTGQNSVLAHHIYQSFPPGEVSVETAMKAGKELADRLLKNQYEYVIATHIDRDHIHNHIIFNSVNMVTGRTFETEQNRGGKVYWKIRRMSDKICEELNLSTVQNAELGKGKTYYEWSMDKQGKSYKSQLKSAIDSAVKTSKSFDNFISKMQAEGYEIDSSGMYLKFKAPGQQRYTRCKTLGYYYTEEKIKERIDKKNGRQKEFIKSLKLPQIIDTTSEKYNNSDGLEHWAKLKNFKAAAEILSYLSEQNVANDEQLAARTDELHEQRIAAGEEIKQLEQNINKLTLLHKKLSVYYTLKPLYTEYRAAKDKDKFFRKNEDNIMLYEETVQHLREVYNNKKLPKISVIEQQLNTLKSKKDRLYDKYRRSRTEAYKLEKMKQQLDKYMKNETKNKQKDSRSR